MARVGVLALQGGYGAHLRALRELGHAAVEVRAEADLEGLEGLVLPGGESTAQLRLIDRHGLQRGLDDLVRQGIPVLATCAGLILAARRVTRPSQPSMGWLEATVARNAWGRQLDSFEAFADRPWDGKPLPLIFIRAPRIAELGKGLKVLAAFQGEPVLVQQGKIFGATFHPELTADRRVHRLAFGGTSPDRTTFAESADREAHHRPFLRLTL